MNLRFGISGETAELGGAGGREVAGVRRSVKSGGDQDRVPEKERSRVRSGVWSGKLEER